MFFRPPTRAGKLVLVPLIAGSMVVFQPRLGVPKFAERAWAQTVEKVNAAAARFKLILNLGDIPVTSIHPTSLPVSATLKVELLRFSEMVPESVPLELGRPYLITLPGERRGIMALKVSGARQATCFSGLD